MKAGVLLVLVLAAALVVLGAEGAVKCVPGQLSPCASAVTSSSPPTRVCCQRVREQKPCLCGYLKNPTLRKFVNNPQVRKIANQCKIPFPKC